MMQAGAKIVVEEYLTGEEASFFAFIDGETCIPLVGAQVRQGAWVAGVLSTGDGGGCGVGCLGR